MITAASEGHRLRRLVRRPPSAMSLCCCGIAGIVANLPTWEETILGARDMSATVGSDSGSGVERSAIPGAGCPACAGRLSALFAVPILAKRSRASRARPNSSISRAICATRRRSPASRATSMPDSGERTTGGLSF